MGSCTNCIAFGPWKGIVGIRSQLNSTRTQDAKRLRLHKEVPLQSVLRRRAGCMTWLNKPTSSLHQAHKLIPRTTAVLLPLDGRANALQHPTQRSPAFQPDSCVSAASGPLTLTLHVHPGCPANQLTH